LKKDTKEEELVLAVQKWGVNASSISCILQMDLDTSKDGSLKFMIVTDFVSDYIDKPAWLEIFGSYTKCHKGNHDLFHVLKVSYSCGVTVSFVLVDAQEKKNIYTFCEMEDLESNVRMLVKKI
jgi:hypothetical protein